jgi:hypothetical protein
MDMKATIKTAINQFPAIKQTVHTEDVLSIAEKDHRSPIVYYLSKSMPDESKVKKTLAVLEKNPKHIGALFILDHTLRPYYVLKHLDNCLSIIKEERKLDTFLDHLLDKNSFWQGYCEIEVASNLKSVFGKIELEPNLPDGKSADIKFPLDSKQIFVEVTAPKRSYKFIKAMEESAQTGKAIALQAPVERVSEKILRELEHFVSMLDQVQSVIIINLNETEIEDIDIEDSLMGVSKLVVSIDRSTHKTETKVAREDWTAFSRDSRLAKIGAIICYSRDFALNGNIIYNKRIFVLSFTEQKYEPLLKLF